MKKRTLCFTLAVLAGCLSCAGAACGRSPASAAPPPEGSWKDRLQVAGQETVSLANPQHGPLICRRTDRQDGESGCYYSDLEIRSTDGGYRRHIAHATRLAPISGSVEVWLQSVDLNGDGAEDIIMDLGASGRLVPSYAFVYDRDSDCFVPVCGYSALGFPVCHFSPEGRPMIVEDCVVDWLDPHRDYDSAWNKYVVSDRQLELVASVTLKYEGDTGGYFTEKQLADGGWKVLRSHVKEGEFDLDAWKRASPVPETEGSDIPTT